MISKSRKKIILTVAIFSIAMILANIIHAGTVSFVPLETKDLSLDNIDDGTYQTPDIDEKVETVRTSFIPQSPIHIDEYGVEGITWEQAKALGLCYGLGTEGSPYRIQYFDIFGGDSVSCITIENSDAYFLIHVCKIHNSKKGDPYEDAGIKLINTNNGKIISNKIYLNENGISLTDCENIIILENSVYDNDDGISIVHSNYNTISRNTVNDNNPTGIAISYSAYNTISRNTVNDNEYMGIYLYESHDNTISKNNIINNGAYDGVGLLLYYSDNNTVSENYLLKNGLGSIPVYFPSFGIYLEDSDENILIKNRILESRVGIYINEISDYNNITENIIRNYDIYGIFNSGARNTIYLNSFYTNLDFLTIVCWHAGWLNYWAYCYYDHGGLGNYWDCYQEEYPWAEIDGLVWDEPFVIIQYDTGYPTYDYFPLVNPYDSRDFEDPIYIDDTNPECDWEWASTQPWCSGSGTNKDPYVIKDLIINGGDSGSCISIKNSEEYFRIENCKVYNSGFQAKDAGIILINTKNGEIINNDVSENWFGITLWNSDGNDVKYNLFDENFIGVIIRDYSSGNNVIGNFFSDHQVGILLDGTSSGNTIDDSNSFSRTRGYDVYYI